MTVNEYFIHDLEHESTVYTETTVSRFFVHWLQLPTPSHHQQFFLFFQNTVAFDDIVNEILHSVKDVLLYNFFLCLQYFLHSENGHVNVGVASDEPTELSEEKGTSSSRKVCDSNVKSGGILQRNRPFHFEVSK